MATNFDFLRQTTFSDDDIARMLRLKAPEDVKRLQERAYELTTDLLGDEVYLRGLIEISNICTANCRYCGIRKSNHAVSRYTLPRHVVIGCALAAARAGYGSIAIQAGERTDRHWVEWISEVYAEWAEASGNPDGLRYLLRIETSNPELFHKLHCTPGRHEKNLEHRMTALRNLRRAGYQVGTGVMIGLPGQTVEDLVQDIRTFQTIDADMIGMGPYLLSKGADMVDCGMMAHDPLLRLSLNMIAATRLVLRDVNIAAATALETLEPNGRILGIMSGCNVVMPNITPQATRSSYQLYDNKSGTEVGAESNTKIESDIVRIAGRRLGLNQLGSSIHWQSRR